MMATFTEWTMYTLATVKNLVYPGKPRFTWSDIPDLSGQVWIITGATGGIGLATATAIASQNAKVWITGRNEAKLEKAVAHIRELVPRAKVDFFVADFGDLTSIKPGVSKVLKSESRLDGIIHNAGQMNVPQGLVTVQGIEQTVGVNNVAPHLLQKLLDPLILTTPQSRLVWLSSLAHALTPYCIIDLENLGVPNVHSDATEYAMSKTINIVQAFQWTKKHPDSTTKSVAAHPGIINTDLFRTAPGWQTTLFSAMFWPTEFGTYSPLYAAFGSDVPNNAYTIPFGRVGQVRPDVLSAVSGSLGEEVWNWLEAKVEPYV